MTIHTYIPIYSTPFTQPTYYNHLLCIWVSRKAMALAVSMLLLEQVCTSGGKHYWKGHQKRPDKQVSSIFPRRALLYTRLLRLSAGFCSRKLAVTQTFKNHLFSTNTTFFCIQKKLFFWCWTSFVFCHQKKRDKHSDSWALLLIWRKVIRYTKYVHNILIAKPLKY